MWLESKGLLWAGLDVLQCFFRRSLCLNYSWVIDMISIIWAHQKIGNLVLWGGNFFDEKSSFSGAFLNFPFWFSTLTGTGDD